MQILHYSQQGEGEPLVILHGLFGSGKNWQTLARRFAESYRVYCVDLRNHGGSFHHQEMTYPAMAEDVGRWLRHLGIEDCRMLGHSMGGKVAMTLSLNSPELVSKLIVADIAPVVYRHQHDNLIAPILALPLEELPTRAAVDSTLAADIADPMLRGFLLQNLYRDGERWGWRVNWAAIQQQMSALTDFPVAMWDWRIEIPTLFLRGEASDYIDEEGLQTIDWHFSDARVETLPGAGHWLHAEQPGRFHDAVISFLG